jgi:hypothetical protein
MSYTNMGLHGSIKLIWKVSFAFSYFFPFSIPTRINTVLSKDKCMNIYIYWESMNMYMEHEYCIMSTLNCV